jgi:hypothetical protein
MRGSAGALSLREAKSGAVGHGTASELSSVGRRGMELHNTWQHRIPPRYGGEVQSLSEQGGEVQSCRACGSTGAHLGREAGSEDARHMVVRGCTPRSLS